MSARGLHGIDLGERVRAVLSVAALNANDVLSASSVTTPVLARVYDAASSAIFTSFTTPPTTARKAVIDDCVVALKSAGIWTKLDTLYAFAAADSQAAKINWINPGTYNSTEVNAPTFTADRGFTGASTKRLDSNFNPSTATTPKFTQNSSSIFAWGVTSGGNGGIFGYAVTANMFIIPSLSGANLSYCLNNSSSDTIANTDGTGFYAAARTGSAASEVYRNGASMRTSTRASTAVPNDTIVFMQRSAAYWTGQCAGAGFGSQLSDGENTSLYDILRIYMTAVGVP